MEKRKYIILIPMESSVVYNFFMSVTEFFLYLKDNNIDFMYYTTSGAAHANARNSLNQEAIKTILEAKKTGDEFTHVIWLDSDMVFKPTDIEILVNGMEEFGTSIMSGTYFSKSADPFCVAMKIATYCKNNPSIPHEYATIKEFDLNKLYDVDSVGFGMVVMRPQVLLDVQKEFGDNPFEFPSREGKVIGEDISYCEKAKFCRHKIDLNTAVLLGHVGSHIMDLDKAKIYHSIALKSDIEKSKRLALSSGWMTLEEGNILKEHAKACAGVGCIVEIGSWKGMSTIELAKGSQEGNKCKVFAVDPHTGSVEHNVGGNKIWTYDEFMKNITEAGVSEIITPIVKTSEEAAKDFMQMAELIYVDGSHEYEDVKKDISLWYPMLVSGGHMIFHDSWMPQVKKAIDEFIFDQVAKAEAVHVTKIGALTIIKKP